MKLSAEKRLFATFLLVVLTTLTAVCLAALNIVNARRAERLVSHSQTVQKALTDLHVAVVETETGQRGYAYTGNTTLLDAYRRGTYDAQHCLAVVGELVSDNRRQRASAVRLGEAVRAKLDFAERVVGARREGDLRRAEALVASGAGEIVTDRIRRIISEMEEEETGLLRDRRHGYNSSNSLAQATVAGLGLLLIAIIPGVFLKMRREMRSRQRTTEWLSESQRRLSTLMGNLPGMAYRCRPDGERAMEFVSKGCQGVTGYTSAELTGGDRVSFARLIHDEDRDRVRDEAQAALARREPFHLHYRLVDREGSVRHVWEQGQGVFEEGGRLVALEGFILDETAEKTAEAALLQANRRKRLIFDHALDVICSIDAEGRFIWLSPASLRVWGYTPEELVGRRYMELVHPDDHGLTEGVAASVMSGVPALDFENRYVRKDGTLAHVVWSAHWSDSEQMMFCVARDVTEGRRAAEALRQSEERFQLAARATSDAVYDLSFADGTLVWSENVSRLFGYSADEVAPRIEWWNARVHPEDHRRVWDGLDETITGGREFWSDEYRFLKADGTYAYVIDRGYISRGPGGEALRMIGAMTDFSDRRRIEEELETARDAALESSRLKSEFLANMSHEIRTPINGVLGMTGMLLDTDLDETQTEYAETVRRCAESLLTVINDILDFSKIEAGKLHFESIDFDLRDAVESVTEMFAGRAQAKRIELASLIYGRVPTALRGDPGRLRQILTNLVSNAIKFTAHGEVVVRATLVEQDAGEAVVKLAVTDTGAGVPAEALPRLFTAFTQADGSTTRRYGGTGLGLSISKQLVEMMGGEIGVESEVGKGSTFWFTARFPKQPAPAQRPRYADVELAGRRVLVADDNETNRRILLHQLSSWGVEAAAAPGGPEALALLREWAAAGRPFDVLISDLQMPGMDGFELARAVKSDPALAPTQIVLLPSFGQRGHADEARRAGAACYLTKPVRQMHLFESLSLVLARAGEADAFTTEGVLITRQSLRERKGEAPALERRRVREQSREEARHLRGEARRILIAEDNPTNQRIAAYQCEQLGYRADVVGNGAEALEALSRVTYGLVLMDCQMPELDGYQATEQLRRREAGTGRRTPVVALTANALTGDRERCLKVGMDDYLAKPVSDRDLAQVIRTWMPGDGPRAGAALEAAAPADDVAATLEGMKRKYGAGMVKSLLDAFRPDTARRLEELRRAAGESDAQAVAAGAHGLKGSFRSLGAARLAGLCGELEREARAGSTASAAATVLELEEGLGLMQTALDAAEAALAAA